MIVRIGIADDGTLADTVFRPHRLSPLSQYTKDCNTLQITHTYNETLSPYQYIELEAAVRTNNAFKYTVRAHRDITHAGNKKDSENAWLLFWNFGCIHLFRKNRLGVVILRFSSKFRCTPTNVEFLREMASFLPKDVPISFQLWDQHWFKEPEAISIIRTSNMWCFSTLYVVNNFVYAGWAGTLPSTHLKSKIKKPKMTGSCLPPQIIDIHLYGAYGNGYGSYDRDGFLERFTDMVKKKCTDSRAVYITFHNIKRGIRNPMPHIHTVEGCLDGLNVELPDAMMFDVLCALHDSTKLRDLLAQR
jgi:uncharacterized protein YecE (DUF72 family)